MYHRSDMNLIITVLADVPAPNCAISRSSVYYKSWYISFTVSLEIDDFGWLYYTERRYHKNQQLPITLSWFYFNPSMDKWLLIHYKVWDEIFIHSQNSTAQTLKFEMDK